jgi:hypothetical protein
MAWEYLDKLDYRYKQAAEFITNEDFVVDVNSGNSRFRDYAKHYICNDLNYWEADYQMTDEQFRDVVDRCDVLCCFGVGGYEITKEPLESQTLSDTMVYLTNKFKPRLLILEAIEQFTPVIENILKRVNYKIDKLIATESDSSICPMPYVLKRKLYICKTQYTNDTKI